MSQQIFTLAGTVIGAALGLFAPMVSSRAGRRERDRDLQRQIASDIMALFENGDSPVQILTPQESRPRRRLYILALRLESHPGPRGLHAIDRLRGQVAAGRR